MRLRKILQKVLGYDGQPRHTCQPQLGAIEWTVDTDGHLIKRSYSTYEQYKQHQESREERIDLDKYDLLFTKALSMRLDQQGFIERGMTVLCLGARQGTEVRVFLQKGCFAVGIDLKPLDNTCVLRGDFHAIQFPDGCADVVFTNSLDHAFDLERIMREVRRILGVKGIVIIEAVSGTVQGVRPGTYESVFWETIDDLVHSIRRCGFQLRARMPFEYPWKGEQLMFEKS